jgi:predicted RecB family nuclease
MPKKPSPAPKGSRRSCPQGHVYFKSSECPTCPQCEAVKKPDSGFLAPFYAPARRALVAAGITSVDELAKHTEAEVMALHGMGKASLPLLQKALKEAGKRFLKSK